MNEEQRYLFDAFGYFVIPDAVSQAQLEELRTTLQAPGEEADPGARLEAPLHWSQAWRDLLEPALSPLLEEVLGNHGRPADSFAGLPIFRIDHINVHTHVAKGFKGGILHGGWKSTGGSQFFRYHDGQFYNGLVAVVFELFDTHPNEGGFCCIPGTHKANLPLPTQWRDLSQGIHPSVQRVPARPGDAIVFTEALTHGTLPWNAEAPRRTLFYKFSPHGTSWCRGLLRPAPLPRLSRHRRPQAGDTGATQRSLRRPSQPPGTARRHQQGVEGSTFRSGLLQRRRGGSGLPASRGSRSALPGAGRRAGRRGVR